MSRLGDSGRKSKYGGVTIEQGMAEEVAGDEDEDGFGSRAVDTLVREALTGTDDGDTGEGSGWGRGRGRGRG